MNHQTAPGPIARRMAILPPSFGSLAADMAAAAGPAAHVVAFSLLCAELSHACHSEGMRHARTARTEREGGWERADLCYDAADDYERAGFDALAPLRAALA